MAIQGISHLLQHPQNSPRIVPNCRRVILSLHTPKAATSHYITPGCNESDIILCMTITTTECEQILKLRSIILSCKEHCETTWDPQQITRYCNEAEFAFRMFAASYAKHLLKPGFPRQNGYFWTDMNKVLKEIDKFISETPILSAEQIPTNNPSPKHHRKHRPRTLSDHEIAAKFNAYSIELVCGTTQDGRPIYEKTRGGSGSGRCRVGTCSISTIKNWIKKYPDRSHAEPRSGFHAGMLTDKNAIDAAAKCWGDYWQGYAKAFFEWRITHNHTPRNQFRYNSNQTILCEDIDRLAIHSHQ